MGPCVKRFFSHNCSPATEAGAGWERAWNGFAGLEDWFAELEDCFAGLEDWRVTE